jgi:hypothetical protein
VIAAFCLYTINSDNMPILQFKNIVIQFLLTFSTLTGISQSIEIEPVCKLPKELNENSGMAAWGDTLLWLVNDSGNDPVLYAIDTSCTIVKKFWVANAENFDWEDLATDKEGNLYIADIGNNSNKRQTLVIYKIPKSELLSFSDTITPEFSICFFYSDQIEFPPVKERRYFDAEALFHFNDSLTLITKNRTNPFDGKALMYRIPPMPGNFSLNVFDTLFTGLGLMELHWVSGADIFNDAVVIALSYDKIILFDVHNPDKKISLDLKLYKQFESIAIGDKYMYISNEKNVKNKPILYRVKLTELEKYFRKIQDL